LPLYAVYFVILALKTSAMIFKDHSRSLEISPFDKLLTSCIAAFIASRVDYCNGVLYGVSSQVIRRLQRVLNAAARLVVGAGRYEHTSIILCLKPKRDPLTCCAVLLAEITPYCVKRLLFICGPCYNIARLFGPLLCFCTNKLP